MLRAEDDAAIVREVDGYEEVPANMEKAASIIRRFAAQQNRDNEPDEAAAIGAEFGKRCANKKHTGV